MWCFWPGLPKAVQLSMTFTESQPALIVHVAEGHVQAVAWRNQCMSLGSPASGAAIPSPFSRQVREALRGGDLHTSRIFLDEPTSRLITDCQAISEPGFHSSKQQLPDCNLQAKCLASGKGSVRVCQALVSTKRSPLPRLHFALERGGGGGFLPCLAY